MSRSFKIKINRGTDLKAADLNGKSDPYVKVLLVNDEESKPTELYKTKVIKKTLNPDWNEEFEVVIPAEKRDLFYNYQVKFDIFDKDLIGKDSLGSATFNFGYAWTAAMPINKEIPIKLPLEKGALHVGLTIQHKGHTSLEEHSAKPATEGFQRVNLKASSVSNVGTVVIPDEFKVQTTETSGKQYLLHATTEGISSIFLTEQPSSTVRTPKDASYIKTKVDTIMGELKKEGAYQWCGPIEPFKIDEENSGLTVGYRSGSNKGDVFTTKYFFYLIGNGSLFTLTHVMLGKRPFETTTPEGWIEYSKEQLALAKKTVLNTLLDSLKIYPVPLFGRAEVGPY